MATNEGPVGVSIIVPVKDEQASIPVLAQEIDAAMGTTSYLWECLWIDDASTDASLAALQALHAQDPRHHRYLSLRENVGQSGALAVGFEAARGGVLATLDADLQNDPADLPRLLTELRTHHVGMVTGIRADRHDSWLRKLSSRIGNGFRNRVTGDPIADVGCSVRVFHARYIRNLPVFRGMHRFLPTLVKMEGCTVVEVPVHHRPRRYGTSKYGIRNRLWVGLLDCLAVRWLLSRQLHPHVALTSEPYPPAHPARADAAD